MGSLLGPVIVALTSSSDGASAGGEDGQSVVVELGEEGADMIVGGPQKVAGRSIGTQF
jgi:hypothetical protein